MGDSRAMAGGRAKSGSVRVRSLNRCHNAGQQDEAARVKQMGGEIRKVPGSLGPLRVFLRNSPAPKLAMTRALGDFLAVGLGISFVPEVQTFAIGAEDEVLVVGSDGVWEFLDEHAVVKTALQGEKSLEACAREIAELAQSEWADLLLPADDTTIILILLGDNALE